MIDKHCEFCGRPFVALRQTAKYCGDVCRVKAQKRRKAKKMVAQPKRKCAVCGKDFRPKTEASRLCSKACGMRETHAKMRAAKEAERHIQQLRHRALTRRTGEAVSP